MSDESNYSVSPKKATICSQTFEFDSLNSLMSPRMRNSLLPRDFLCLRCKLVEVVLSKKHRKQRGAPRELKHSNSNVRRNCLISKGSVFLGHIVHVTDMTNNTWEIRFSQLVTKVSMFPNDAKYLL